MEIDPINLRKRYEEIIKKGNEDEKNIENYISELRKLVLLHGLPDENEEDENNMKDGSGCTLRGLIWKIFLQVDNINAKEYISLIEKGRCEKRLFWKIKDDTCRTFKNDEIFHKRVPEEQLVRLLNTFLNKCENQNKTSELKLTYVQGMNLLCGALLYTMPEIDAFYAFDKLISDHCPLYAVSQIKGVYQGIYLFDQIVKIVDPELHTFFQQTPDYNKIYFFSPIMSFSAGTPPFTELLHLWDFMFAFGVHLNVVFVVAQVILLRDEILKSKNLNDILHTLPKLNAKLIISISIYLIKQLPDELYEQLVQHSTTILDQQLSFSETSKEN
ncbi:mitotic check point protein bub2 [Anaeramoeba ignava]|uniref:Mitotic check point protein bub2 n=1 Tax=Anaeramoeba ignava TaxID=1746090 RepID=A0A9Q0R631_ANAIG|nr:mitotic check point protein bub2 [Anaeramoeba ignava]KAJ5068455.1 mitotic check point protein bub2 [Anaeramoeba ignava]